MRSHLNRDKIKSNLSVPGIQGCNESALCKNFETSPYLLRLYASTNSQGQPKSKPDPEAGPKRILTLTYRAILGQLENVVKNIYPEGAMFAGMLGHMPFLLKDN